MHFISIALTILFLAGLLYLAYNRANIKGFIGERKLSSLLMFLDKEVYHTYNNIYIETKRNTSQIDHLVVSQFGIFVIETKNYKGIISGSFKSNNWTQNIWRNKYSIPNPIRQNKAHIYALKSILPNYAQSSCVSIIAFSSSATLYVTTDESTEVIYIHDILRTIKSFNNIVFSSEQVDKICNTIYQANIKDKDVRKNHKYAIQRMVYNRNIKIKSGICPNCGAELVRRHGKFGSFIGCSRFPQCKFTTK